MGCWTAGPARAGTPALAGLRPVLHLCGRTVLPRAGSPLHQLLLRPGRDASAVPLPDRHRHGFLVRQPETVYELTEEVEGNRSPALPLDRGLEAARIAD